MKLNILRYLATDIIKEKFKKQDIESIFTENNAKGYKDFWLILKKSNKNIGNVLNVVKPKEEVELNEETKNEISEQIKEYFNGMKDDVLGNTLIKNLKKLKINSSKYNKMKASIENIIKKYFLKDANFNFENIFDELKNEKDHSKYLEILKEFDLIRYVNFKKDILAKDEFKNCLESFFKEYNIKECKDIEISTNNVFKDIKYHLYLNIPRFKKINHNLKRKMMKYLKDCFNKGKKEIFKKVFKNLKTIDTKGEEYNNMINKLEKMCKKHFIIKDGQNVNKMLEDIFDNLKKETKYENYLTFIDSREILRSVTFGDYRKKKNKEENMEEDVEEENMEEENMEEEDVEGVEEEDVEESDEENVEEEGDEKEDVEEEGDEEEDVEGVEEEDVEEENMEEEDVEEQGDEEEDVKEENVEKSNKQEENMEEENVEKSDEEEGNKYKHLRAMNEYKNTDPLNYLNDVNHFAKKMQNLKEDETILDGENLKEKVVDEHSNFLGENIFKEYNIISNKNDSKEKELNENGNFLGENIFKEKNNEYFDLNPFNFNPKKILT